MCIAADYLTESSHKKTMIFASGVSFRLLVDKHTLKNCKSSNPKAIKITKSGKVTVLKKGTATLSGTLPDGAKYTRKIKCGENPYFDSLAIDYSHSPHYLVVKKGKTAKIHIFGKAYAINNVVYKSKHVKLVSGKSSDKIKIKGIKRGKTTLKIKVNNSYILKVKVKVK